MICGKCGAEIPEKNLFCLECGARIDFTINSETRVLRPQNKNFMECNPFLNSKKNIEKHNSSYNQYDSFSYNENDKGLSDVSYEDGKKTSIQNGYGKKKVELEDIKKKSSQPKKLAVATCGIIGVVAFVSISAMFFSNKSVDSVSLNNKSLIVDEDGKNSSTETSSLNETFSTENQDSEESMNNDSSIRETEKVEKKETAKNNAKNAKVNEYLKEEPVSMEAEKSLDKADKSFKMLKLDDKFQIREYPELVFSTTKCKDKFNNEKTVVAITNISEKELDIFVKGVLVDKNSYKLADAKVDEKAVAPYCTVFVKIDGEQEDLPYSYWFEATEIKIQKSKVKSGRYSYKWQVDNELTKSRVNIEIKNINKKNIKIDNIHVFFINDKGEILDQSKTSLREMESGRTATVFADFDTEIEILKEIDNIAIFGNSVETK